MKLRDVMTRRVESVGPDTTLEDAARRMEQLNVGAMPVVEGGRVIGMVTDRDIVVRGVASGRERPRPRCARSTASRPWSRRRTKTSKRSPD